MIANLLFPLLWPNSLYRAACFANFEGILGFSVPSIILADLLGNKCLLVIGAFRSTLFVSVFQGSLLVTALFRAIVDQFSSNIFLIFLILVSWKNKAMSASCPLQKYHSSSRFPSLFLSSLESFSVLFLRAKLGECVALWLTWTPPQLKCLTEQKNPFEVCKCAARYNECDYKTVELLSSPSSAVNSQCQDFTRNFPVIPVVNWKYCWCDFDWCTQERIAHSLLCVRNACLWLACLCPRRTPHELYTTHDSLSLRLLAENARGVACHHLQPDWFATVTCHVRRKVSTERREYVR